jgi:hypothetical protein
VTERRWLQVGGAGGILFVALLFSSSLLAPLSVPGGEPAFDAPAKDLLAYAQATHDLDLPTYLGELVSLFGFALFAASLNVRLRTRDDHAHVLSTLVVVAAGVAIALFMAAGGAGLAATFRARDLDASVVSVLFGLANGLFVISWFALAAFLISACLGALSSRALPRWLAWAGLLIACGYLVAGAAPLSKLALVPHLLFYIWVVAVGVVLLRSPAGEIRTEERVEPGRP